MPILHAEIQVGGRQVPFVAGSFSFWQITDYIGRPSTDVRLGLIELTLVGEAATWSFWEDWMLDPHRRQSGRLIFFQNEDQKAKTVIFYDAFCVHFECRFDARGQYGHGSFETEIHLSAAAKEVQGQFSEAHSVIPWDADKDTRYRALTKPKEYLPSAALAVKALGSTPENLPTSGSSASKRVPVLLAIARAVNPLNGQQNCTHITEAVVARLRGTNPDAVAPDLPARSLAELEAVHNTTVEFGKNFYDIFKQIQEAEEGTAAVVVTLPKEGGIGHVVTITNHNGTATIIEGQDWGPGLTKEVITSPSRAIRRYGDEEAVHVGLGLIPSPTSLANSLA
ncbi:toxin glutamine deamidase domain-containing protein [Hymenobacter tibetensis]|uniref:Toxin glutamine deamidase domain-containing protein n=1 Tax=Hymenobacter tibetensis TaxID=497967 RepID=A0ABY4CW30_9BACT|nr:type VI secretion system tube protein TssD [Hymenobacter tibetensis]UOG74478.1 toxin glutamine deamidase domain-containing protein [Hymenobacter tibetensis]